MPRKKSKRYNATITMKVVVEVDDGYSPEDVIKNGTEFLAEPKNAQGCVMAMNILNVEINK